MGDFCYSFFTMNKNFNEPFPFNIQPASQDETYMLAALKEAWQAYIKGEVPVGAVLVKAGRVIARGHNQVEMLRDATAHAEMLCITSAEAAEENWRLKGSVLYCTIEPCSMCAGAMLLSRVDGLVWGAPDIRHGANGSWVDLFDKPHPTHEVQVKNGVLADYCAALMQNFFRQRRKEKKDGVGCHSSLDRTVD